ncbi:MAG: hypothetical protein WBW06_05905 [Xanthobacteraceae bacterium]|jgi:hypothetical protein
MSSKTKSVALTLGLAVASIAAPLGTNSAIAQGPPTANQWQDSRGYYYGYGVPGPYRAGFGYIYVPGRGILDAPCGLPTSACTNSENGAD